MSVQINPTGSIKQTWLKVVTVSFVWFDANEINIFVAKYDVRWPVLQSPRRAEHFCNSYGFLNIPGSGLCSCFCFSPLILRLLSAIPNPNCGSVRSFSTRGRTTAVYCCAPWTTWATRKSWMFSTLSDNCSGVQWECNFVASVIFICPPSSPQIYLMAFYFVPGFCLLVLLVLAWINSCWNLAWLRINVSIIHGFDWVLDSVHCTQFYWRYSWNGSG